MNTNEILKECADRGYPITRQGFYDVGLRVGFLTGKGTRDNPVRKTFNREKFEEWLAGKAEEVPEGWIRVKKASDTYGISVPMMYILVNDGTIESKRIGSGKGITYVRAESVEEYIGNGGKHSDGGDTADEQ